MYFPHRLFVVLGLAVSLAGDALASPSRATVTPGASQCTATVFASPTTRSIMFYNRSTVYATVTETLTPEWIDVVTPSATPSCKATTTDYTDHPTSTIIYDRGFVSTITATITTTIVGPTSTSTLTGNIY